MCISVIGRCYYSLNVLKRAVSYNNNNNLSVSSSTPLVQCFDTVGWHRYQAGKNPASAIAKSYFLGNLAHLGVISGETGQLNKNWK